MLHTTIDNPSLNVINRDYLYQIAEGNIEDHEIWSKIGYATGLTTEATITPQLGDYVFPTAAMQMSVRSSDNGNDKAGGTGALVVTVYYLNNKYEEKSEDVVLTGTTWVDTVATDIFRVNNMRVATTGSTGKPAGNISIADKATRAITYGYIMLGTNRQRQCVYTVPGGKTLYIVTANASSVTTAANKYVRATLLANYDDKKGDLTKVGLQFMAYIETILSSDNMAITLPMPLKFRAQTDLKGNAVSDGNATVAVALRGWLEKDER